MPAGSPSANFRGNFFPPGTSPALVEGHIAVPASHLNSGKALDAILTEMAAGVMQIMIMQDVPCLKFQ